MSRIKAAFILEDSDDYEPHWKIEIMMCPDFCEVEFQGSMQDREQFEAMLQIAQNILNGWDPPKDMTGLIPVTAMSEDRGQIP